ncbi:hypothetical protein HYALB_00008247 [Hymenoscyphus albidus]|uniref:Uncharacterized protein n=1 Tax=Hymenoscyphus albidus TaxID=595503 RepID=A0A9N9LNI7_9HELO|nr:hypothetical protein HYALB_00008247 [Hymenoscyphus albidus]
MAYSQSSPGDTPSPGIGEASHETLDIYQNQNRRSRTTSPKPLRRNQRSATNSRASSPNPLAFLHEGLVNKVRVLRADATSHPTDMLVCPSDPTLSAKWCNLTAKIHEAAGPKLVNLVSNRYSAGISNPPSKRWSEYVNDNDIESPFKSFFNTVKHSPSFEMTNCDWLAHSCVPSYGHTNGRDVKSLNDRQINERNNEKYNSVYLALKKAHLVALVHWTRAFSIAIPQVQYDAEFYTPRDDAILTLAAIVDFFNHPVWGARRCNTIKRVDIIIDPTDDGIPYVEAYEFAWHVMNMQSKGKDIVPLIGSKKGFLRRPFPIYRPPLPARDPDANYQPPRLMHDVLSLPTDIETTDNSQQVPESQEWNLLEQAKLDEDGDSIFGEFIQESISDFQDSDAGLGNRYISLLVPSTSMRPPTLAAARHNKTKERAQRELSLRPKKTLSGN